MSGGNFSIHEKVRCPEQADATPLRYRSGIGPEGVDDAANEGLLRTLTDMLIMPDGLIQPQERAFAADLLHQVLQYSGDATRRSFCQRVAGLSEAPETLIRWMLRSFSDDAVEPLLRSGVCIKDADLIALIEEGSAERLFIIAGRDHLSSVASAALVKRGVLDAICELISNPVARIDVPTLATLCDLATAEPELRNPLAMRPELTPACALNLFWVLPPKWRAHMFSRFLTDCQVLPQVLVMAREAGDLISGALRCAGARPRGEGQSVVRQSAGGRAAVAELVTAVQSDNSTEVARIIVDLGLAVPECAQRIAADPGGEALAAVCKVAGVSRFNFYTACSSWRAAHPGDNGEFANPDDLQIVFDTLSFKQARMALTYWNWQATGSGPYVTPNGSANVDARSAA